VQAEPLVAVLLALGVALAQRRMNSSMKTFSTAFVLHGLGGFLRGGIHIGSKWLKDSEGMSESNHAILAETAAGIGRLRGPWSGCDWNVTPQLLAASGWLDVDDGVIVAPTLPTCNQSTYDFFVVCRGLLPSVAGIQRFHDGGLSPHFPSRLLLRGEARRHLVCQIVRPKLVPLVFPHWPLPHPEAMPPDGIHTLEQLNEPTLLWHQATCTEWRSLADDLANFHALRFRWVPAAGPLAEQVADSAKGASQSRQLAMRFDEAASITLGQITQPRSAPAVLRRHIAKSFQLMRAIDSEDKECGAIVFAWLVGSMRDVGMGKPFLPCAHSPS